MSDLLEMPDGSSFRILERPEDPEVGPLVMEFLLVDGCGAPPPHVHPSGQSETFECLDGWFELLVDREWRRLDPGDSIEVRSGVRHTFRNKSGADARVHNVHAPAHSFERYIRRIHALATETGAVSPNSPVVAARFAQLIGEHSDTIVLADPPMRIAGAVLGRVAKVFGASAPQPTA